jgi:hypothetical protein
MMHPAMGQQIAREIASIKNMLTPPDLNLAQKALDAICIKMDVQGKELFMNWLHGRVDKELILNNNTWQAYMNADVSHRIGLEKKLREVANAQRQKMIMTNAMPVAQTFSTQGFAAYVGKEGGGYWRGYEQLHGANMRVGGMRVVSGKLRAQKGPAPYDYSVTFSDLDLEFNDITDPAHGNLADGAAANGFELLAKALNVGPPKDYITRVRWRSNLTVNMALGPNFACNTNWRT